MGWFHCPYKYFLLFLFLMLCLENINSDNNVCPKYCSCYMWNSDLRRADCINKRLINIDAELPQSVQALDLSNNSIHELKNNEFKDLGLTQLKYISIKFNKISSIGLRAFNELKQLQVIDLSHNHLHLLLPLTFVDTPSLNVLLLSHNHLGGIRAGFLLESSSIQELDIGNCQLGMIQSELFSQLPSLKRLNLTSNQLVRANAAAFHRLSMLVEVDLSNNPLYCDEITKELQLWFSNHQLKDTTGCKKEEQRFAKIITAVNASTETEMMDDDLTKYWFETARERDKEENDNGSVSKEDSMYSFNPVQYFEILEKIPSVWALLIGFEVGVVITIFGMYLWLRGPKLPKMHIGRPRSGRHNEFTWRELRTDMPDCPETPPPPYRTRSTFNL